MVRMKEGKFKNQIIQLGNFISKKIPMLFCSKGDNILEYPLIARDLVIQRKSSPTLDFN